MNGAIGNYLARNLLAERGRWALWYPVLAGLGAGLYFSISIEPRWWLAPLLFLVCAVSLRWLTGASKGLAVILMLAALGFSAAQLQTYRAQMPLLTATTGVRSFAGVVDDIDILPSGCRVTLKPLGVQDFLKSELPRLIRLRLRQCPVETGEQIEGRALLFPTPRPVIPGGYDFQRQLYFQGIGATGLALGRIYESPLPLTGIQAVWRSIRHAMTRRIMTALPGAEGGIAAALITGEKDGIPPDVAQNFRDAGLAHMLVIAGLHMTLVTGFVFFAVRAVLALVPWVALRVHTKKVAAFGSLVAAIAYLAISGAAVPTERAFFMCALAILAILVDRIVFSLRGLALAAWMILLVNPVALMGVSFQMSFAAVVTLLGFHENFGRGLAVLGQGGAGRKILLEVLGIAIATVVATIGTLPFTIYHFGSFALYSVLANVIAVPLSGIWILPWAVVACLLMPFGLEALALIPMSWGIEVTEAVARWTAHLPNDVVKLPALPAATLLAISLGWLWLLLWRGRWRFWGLGMAAMAAASALAVRSPDILVADDGRLAGLRGDDGTLYVTSLRRGKMTSESWQTATAASQTQSLPENGNVPVRGIPWVCDPGRCVRVAAGTTSILIRWHLYDSDPCPVGDLIISVWALPDRCAAGSHVLDPRSAALAGARTVWLGSSPRIRSAAMERGTRPWIAGADVATEDAAQ